MYIPQDNKQKPLMYWLKSLNTISLEPTDKNSMCSWDKEEFKVQCSFPLWYNYNLYFIWVKPPSDNLYIKCLWNNLLASLVALKVLLYFYVSEKIKWQCCEKKWWFIKKIFIYYHIVYIRFSCLFIKISKPLNRLSFLFQIIFKYVRIWVLYKVS